MRELLLATTCLVSAAPALAQTAPVLPTGGKVTSGAGTISTPNSSKMVINQTSDRLLLDWQSFSIGKGGWVDFQQPSSSAIAFNRVNGSAASIIDGRLTANGHVWLSNPNGIVVGAGAVVDVGGFIATTSSMSRDNFDAGKYAFDQAGNPGAAVINRGEIKAASVVLSGERVSNEGIVVADMGTVVLAGAKTFTVDLWGDKLVKFEIGAGADAPLVENSGRISANGGRVLMTARAAKSVVDNVINTTGIVEAKTAQLVNGEIVFDGGDRGMVQVAGTVDASGKGPGETGGTVKVLGEKVALTGAKIDVSGDSGGGTVLLGGALGGAATEREARSTKLDASTVVTADALASGNGGTVVVWSGETTQVDGRISARGGVLAGDGGFIETSSRGSLGVAASAVISAAAPNGAAGSWLLDPHSLIVASNVFGSGGVSLGFTTTSITDKAFVDATVISSFLNSGSVTLNAGAGGAQAGDITIAAPITKTGFFFTALTINAQHDVNVQAPITATSGALSVTLTAPGAVNVAASVTTRGGTFQAASAQFTNTGAIAAGSGLVLVQSNAITLAAPIAAGQGAFVGGAGSSFVQQAGGAISIGNFSNLGISADTITLGAGISSGSGSFLAISSASAGKSIGIGSGAGNITFTQAQLAGISGFGNVALGNANTSAINIDGPVALPNALLVTLNAGQASGTVNLGAAAALTAGSSLTLQTGGGGTLTQAAGATVSAGSTLTLRADHATLAGAAASLKAGTQVFVTSQTFGNTIDIGGAGSVTQADLARLSAPTISFVASQFNLSGAIDTAGRSFIFQGATNLDAATTLTTGGGNLSFNGTLSAVASAPLTINAGTGSVTFFNSDAALPPGAVTVAAGQVVLNGNFFTTGTQTYTASGGITIAGNISSNGAPIAFNGPVRVSGTVVVDATTAALAGEDVVFSGTVDGTSAFSDSLTAIAGLGHAVSFAGNVGSTVPLNLLEIQSPGFSQQGALRASNLHLFTNSLSLLSAANLSGDEIVISAYAPNQTLGVNAAGDLSIDNATLAKTTGFTRLVLGNDTTSLVTVGDTTIAQTHVTFRSRLDSRGVSIEGTVTVPSNVEFTFNTDFFSFGASGLINAGAGTAAALHFDSPTTIFLDATLAATLNTKFAGFGSQFLFADGSLTVSGTPVPVTLNRDSFLFSISPMSLSGTLDMGTSSLRLFASEGTHLAADTVLKTTGFGSIDTTNTTITGPHALTIDVGTGSARLGSLGVFFDPLSAITVLGSATVPGNASMVTAGGPISLGDLALGAPFSFTTLSIDTTGSGAAPAGAAVTFGGIIHTTSLAGFPFLTVNAGSSNVTFIGDIGFTVGGLSNLTVSSAHDVTVGNVNVAVFNVTTVPGGKFIQSPGTTTRADASLSLTADIFNFDGAGSVLTLGSAASVVIDTATVGGALNVGGLGGISPATFSGFTSLFFGNGQAGTVNIANGTSFAPFAQFNASNAVHLVGEVIGVSGLSFVSPVILDNNSHITAANIGLFSGVDSAAAAHNALTLNASGTVQLGQIGATTALGALIVSAPQIFLQGSVTTVNNQDYFANSSVTLSGGITLTSQNSTVNLIGPVFLNGSVNIFGGFQFEGSLDSEFFFGGSLTIDALGRPVTFNGPVGSGAALNQLVITNAGDVNIGDFRAGSITATGVVGTTTLSGAVDLTNFSSITNGGIVLESSAQVTVGSGLTLTGTGQAPVSSSQTPISIQGNASVKVLSFAQFSMVGDVIDISPTSSIAPAPGAIGTQLVMTAFNSGSVLHIQDAPGGFLRNAGLAALGNFDTTTIGDAAQTHLTLSGTTQLPNRTVLVVGAGGTIAFTGPAVTLQSSNANSLLSLVTGAGGTISEALGTTIDVGLGSFSAITNSISLGGAIVGSQSATLHGLSTVGVAGGAGNLQIAASDITKLQSFDAIFISGAGTLTIDGAFNTTKNTIFATTSPSANIVLGANANIDSTAPLLGFSTDTLGQFAKSATAAINVHGGVLAIGADSFAVTAGAGVFQGSSGSHAIIAGPNLFDDQSGATSLGGSGAIQASTLAAFSGFDYLQVGAPFASFGQISIGQTASLTIGTITLPALPVDINASVVTVSSGATLTAAAGEKLQFFGDSLLNFGNIVATDAHLSIQTGFLQSFGSSSLVSNGGAIDIANTIFLSGASTISSAGGTITLGGPIVGAGQSLTVDAGVGLVAFGNSVGSFFQPLASLTVTAGAVGFAGSVASPLTLAAQNATFTVPSVSFANVSLGASPGETVTVAGVAALDGLVRTTGTVNLVSASGGSIVESAGGVLSADFSSAVTLASNSIALGGSVTGLSGSTLSIFNATFGSIGLGTASGQTLNLSAASIGAISGFSKVTLGGANTTAFTIAGSVALKSPTQLLTGAAGIIDSQAGSSLTSVGQLTLAADTLLLNGSLSGSNLRLLPGGNTSVIALGDGLAPPAGATLSISDAQIAKLTGFQLLEIGNINTTSVTTINVGDFTSRISTGVATGNAAGTVNITGHVTAVGGSFVGFSANTVVQTASSVIDAGAVELVLASRTPLSLSGTLSGSGAVVVTRAPINGSAGGALFLGAGGVLADFTPLSGFKSVHLGASTSDLALLGIGFNYSGTILNAVTLPLAAQVNGGSGSIAVLGTVETNSMPLAFNSFVNWSGPLIRTTATGTGAALSFANGLTLLSGGTQTLDAGVGALSVTGDVSGAGKTLGVNGSGAASFGGAVTLDTLDLSAKTGGSVAVAGRAVIDFVDTGPAPTPGQPGVPFSISFNGGGLIDPVFENGGTVSLTGTFGVTDLVNGLVVPLATTQVSGSVNTLNAPINLATLVLTGNTVLNAGPGGTITLGSVTQGIFDLTLIDASGTRFLPGFRPPQNSSQVGDALGSLFSGTGGSSGGLGVVLAGLTPPVIDTGVKVTDTSTQGGLVSTTAGFEAQTEGGSEGGGAPQGAPPTGGGAPPPKQASQKEASPVSPVAPLLGGLVGVFQSTVLKAPPGVPGIDQPYSSDGNFGRW